MKVSAATARLAASAAFLSLRLLTDQMNGQFRSSRSRKPASADIRDVSLETSMNQLGSELELERMQHVVELVAVAVQVGALPPFGDQHRRAAVGAEAALEALGREPEALHPAGVRVVEREHEVRLVAIAVEVRVLPL